MILILTPFFPPNIGGVEMHFLDYIKFLNKKKVKVIVLTYQPITTKAKAPLKEQKGNVVIYRFPYPGFNLFYKLEAFPFLQFGYLFSGLFIYSFLYVLFMRKRIKTIHSHGLAAALVSGLLAKIYKKRTVVSLHTIYKFSQRKGFAWFAKKILKLNNHILTIAPACKNDLVNIGIDRSQISIYSYWINLRQFRPLNREICREKLNLSKHKFIALFVGRFTPEKQLKKALQSAKYVPKADFLFIGEGPLEDEVKRYSKKFLHLKLVGKIDNNLLPFYYNAADLLIFGPVDEDYFGKAAMEALASSLPILITNKSCYFGKTKKISSEILNNPCCLSVDPHPKKISRLINKLMRERSKLKILRKTCRQYSLCNFSETNALTIYQSYK